MKHILITGGAGFIGSFLTDELIKKGYRVRILDNLEPQVHGKKKPSYLNSKAEFIKGDVTNYNVFKKALKGIDIVYHLAARVGVGQSNYEIKNYSDVNIGGMANLWDIIVNEKLPIKKIIMTASMTSYGEGDCKCKKCGIVQPTLRPLTQMKKKDWNLYCPNCNRLVVSIPTKERSEFNNNSIYALTKNVQESMMMLLGKMYQIPVISLRCFNVYGPRQSLSNPYTGVSAIFISRFKNDNQPIVYEDGMQSRDFISVHDVVDALILVMKNKKADYAIFNMGSGTPIPIKEIAQTIAKLLKKNIEPKVNEGFRINDIRHCYADISKIKKYLNWQPKVTLEQGLKELIAWSENEKAIDTFEKAEKELKQKKLL